MANCECGILRLKLEHAEERLANLQRINNALAAAVSNPRIIKFGLDWKQKHEKAVKRNLTLEKRIIQLEALLSKLQASSRSTPRKSPVMDSYLFTDKKARIGTDEGRRLDRARVITVSQTKHNDILIKLSR